MKYLLRGWNVKHGSYNKERIYLFIIIIIIIIII